MCSPNSKYFVSFSRGFLFAIGERYSLMRNFRLATPFDSWNEADASAKEALPELSLPDTEGYYAILQPASGNHERVGE